MGLQQSVASPSTSLGYQGEPQILICGAGIAGLTLANRLEQLGFKSIWIVEADQSLESRPQGYSLTMQQPGQKALKTLGLLDVVRSCSRWGGGGQHFVHAQTGSIIRSIGGGGHQHPVPTGTAKSRRNFYVPRQKLRAILAKSLVATKIIFSEQIADYEESDDVVTATLRSGRKMSSALLVGCDGVNSAVRKQKLSDRLRYLGVGIINGIVDSSLALCHAGSLHVLDGSHRLFMKPFQGEQEAMWQLSFPEKDLKQIEAIRALPKEELHALAMRETSSWCPLYRSIIEVTNPSTLRASGLFDRDPLLCAEHTGARTALIGDAAHPMSPFIGQGANQAMADSIQLAEALCRCRCPIQRQSPSPQTPRDSRCFDQICR